MTRASSAGSTARVLLALVLGGGLASVAAQESAAPEPSAPTPFPERPNLLVILLDDWGVDRFDGFPGQPDTTARTPVLDAFAARNVLFTRAYTDPVCSPSRAAALTGEYGLRTGVGNGFPWFHSDDETFVLEPSAHAMLPAALAAQGYRCFAVGKWHLTGDNFEPDPYMHPIACGFHVHDGVITNLVEARGAGYGDYELTHADAEGARQQQVHDGTYLSTRQVDDALRLIASAGEQPWFTWLALTAPHAPWHRPPQELVSVDVDTLALDDDEALYDAVLEAVDTEIGRLLRGIDPDTLARTVVLVMGDNGTPGNVFSAPGESAGKKGFADEGGIHVPLIVSAPGLAAGTRDQLVHIVDLHATLLELAGASPVANDSISFAPTLRGEVGAPRAWVYSARRRPLGFPEGRLEFERRSIRNEHWKLIVQSGSNDQRKAELRYLGDALFGEGERVETPSDASRAARQELRALLDALEASAGR